MHAPYPHEIDFDGLNIRVIFEGRSIPVQISRDAMFAHFGAEGEDPDVLLRAYRKNADCIEAQVLTKAISGAVYTRAKPLAIRASDFCRTNGMSFGSSQQDFLLHALRNHALASAQQHTPNAF